MWSTGENKTLKLKWPLDLIRKKDDTLACEQALGGICEKLKINENLDWHELEACSQANDTRGAFILFMWLFTAMLWLLFDYWFPVLERVDSKCLRLCRFRILLPR